LGDGIQMSGVSRSVELFRSGYACSQAILATYGPALSLPHEAAMRVAAGFAAGMRLGETCGVVTGALMTLGLRHGSENCDTAEGRADVYVHVVEFTKRFRERSGSLACRELLGCDVSTPEGLQQAKDRNLFMTTCVKMVENAATILEEMEAERQAAMAGDG
jgi:C_GCAxxG_C_C family probable redox protein